MIPACPAQKISGYTESLTPRKWRNSVELFVSFVVGALRY